MIRIIAGSTALDDESSAQQLLLFISLEFYFLYIFLFSSSSLNGDDDREPPPQLLLMIVQKATHLGNWSRNGATAVWGTRVTGPNTYKNDRATPSWLLVFISFLFIFLSHLLLFFFFFQEMDVQLVNCGGDVFVSILFSSPQHRHHHQDGRFSYLVRTQTVLSPGTLYIHNKFPYITLDQLCPLRKRWKKKLFSLTSFQ